jgi:hypothetical protein
MPPDIRHSSRTRFRVLFHTRISQLLEMGLSWCYNRHMVATADLRMLPERYLNIVGLRELRIPLYREPFTSDDLMVRETLPDGSQQYAGVEIGMSRNLPGLLQHIAAHEGRCPDGQPFDFIRAIAAFQLHTPELLRGFSPENRTFGYRDPHKLIPYDTEGQSWYATRFLLGERAKAAGLPPVTATRVEVESYLIAADRLWGGEVAGVTEALHQSSCDFGVEVNWGRPVMIGGGVVYAFCSLESHFRTGGPHYKCAFSFFESAGRRIVALDIPTDAEAHTSCLYLDLRGNPVKNFIPMSEGF